MKKNPALTDLSLKLGELVHNWGFKRIHGRIWTRLFLSSRPLDAADLIEQLDISKALVSISLRELLDLRAVEDCGRSARGTNLYRANGNLNEIYLSLLKNRERMMLEQTSAALSTLAGIDAVELNESEISGEKLNQLASHLHRALGSLNDYVSKQTDGDGSVVSFQSPASATLKASPDAQNAMVLPARGGY